MAQWWNNNMYLLTEWEGRTGKYLARGHDVRTERSEVRASWPRAKYFPVRPDQTQSISILSYDPTDPLFVFSCCCFFIGWWRAALLRAVFQGANDIAPFMWESQWSFERCGFQSTQSSVRSGLILTKYRCEKFTFSLNLHNPNVSVMDERMLKLWNKNWKDYTKIESFCLLEDLTTRCDVSSELNFVKFVLNQKARD